MATTSLGMIGVVQVLFLLGLGGPLGVPLGMPPGADDPLMARVAPEQCLFYASWVSAAEPDPQSGNATERLLAEPEVQQFVAKLNAAMTAAITAWAEEEGPPESAPALQRLPLLLTRLATRATAVYVAEVRPGDDGPPKIEAGLLSNLGDHAAETKVTLELLQRTFAADHVERVTVAGAEAYRLAFPDAPPVTWCLRGRYLLVGVGDQALEKMLGRAAAAAGEPPEWLAEIGAQLPVPRRASISYVNLRGILERANPREEVRQVFESLGLDQVTHLASVTGLDDEGFVSRTLIGVEGEPRGVLAVVGATPLAAADLATVPADATAALALRADAGELFDRLLALLGAVEPRARREIEEEALPEIQRALEINIRDDLLAALGDVWTVYVSPGEGGSILTGVTASVTLRDRAQFAAAHEKLLAAVRESLAPHGERFRGGPQLHEVEFAGKTIYLLDTPLAVAPAWCIVEDRLVVALFPQSIKAVLSRDADFTALDTAPRIAGLFAAGARPVALAYVDTAELFRMVYPWLQMGGQALLAAMRDDMDVDLDLDLNIAMLPSARAVLPHLKPSVGLVQRTPAGIELQSRQSLPGTNVGAMAPVLAGLAIPAVSSAQHTSQRMQGMNNLRQICVAAHNFAAVHRGFPAAYSTDAEGKPLLSWRVYLLPYLEEQSLFEQFRLDEPWNSEHNRKLLEKMPAVFKTPDSKLGPGMTNYVAIRGEDSVIMPPAEAEFGKRVPRGTGFAAIRDGLSNTILLVEADDVAGVPWTAPDDLTIDLDQPLKGLGGLRRGGFLAAFADGHVRYINVSIDAVVLRALFTKSGGEAIGFDEF